MSYFDILAAKAGAGGGTPTPPPVLIEKSVTQNGTYSAEDDEADGYSSVTVNVPNTYSVSDEGKVVSNGALVAQTSDTVTENGTVDTTLINSLMVNVSASGGGAAYYTRYKATSSTSTWTSLGFGIVGDKGTEGSIFVSIYGLVSTSTFSPNNPLVLTDFTLSDYLTSNVTMTVSCNHANTNNYFSLTFDVANNQLSFSQGNFMEATGTFSGFTTTTL